MSWLFSRRLMDEYLPDLQPRIQTEAERASLLLSNMSSKEQCKGACWSENWLAVQTIQAAAHERRLLKDVCSQAPIRQWAKRNDGACDGDGMPPKTTFICRGNVFTM